MKQETLEEAKQRAANYMSLKGALEPKQETLEEAAKNYVRNESDATLKLISKYSFKDGAKWQQKRMYSEGVICKDCKEVISVDDINNHLFMKIKGGGLIHWNCETI